MTTIALLDLVATGARAALHRTGDQAYFSIVLHILVSAFSHTAGLLPFPVTKVVVQELAMRYRILGRWTGLKVSELALGSGMFGQTCGHGATQRAIMTGGRYDQVDWPANTVA